MDLRPPEACTSMAELRKEIDALDESLVKMLALRSTYIDRAIELKPDEGIPARANDRVEEVVRRVRAAADRNGLDPALVETLWRDLIEWSIAREQEKIS
ncbi:chorismate mutase [Amaricoccus tamworthensis]|uniref:chorismate mutase n=1 Tax=Amaricoccus tamworthensis TaxID=57002 RepID=UPI003C7C352C